jgi:hypothetical protein
MRYGRLQGASRLRQRSPSSELRASWAIAPAAGLLVSATCISLAFGAWGGDEHASFAADRADALPTSKPLAAVGLDGGGAVSVRRLDPLTLAPTGRRAVLGEYHRAYSFAPDGKGIAFGISAAPQRSDSVIGCCGRVGIRLVRKRKLRVKANIRTGTAAVALAWLRKRRLVALAGGGVRTVNPNTGRTLKLGKVPFDEFHCDAADARKRALIVLADRRLFVIGPGGDVRTFELPPEFAQCGRIALPPSYERVFVVADGGDPIVELELENSELTVHSTPTGAVGEVDAIGFSHRRLVLARRDESGLPLGVEVFDLETGSTTMIDPEAGEARLVKGTVLAFDGGSGAGPIGVRGYLPDGERRFQLLGRKRIVRVEARGPFAWAMHRRGVAVIDVPSGIVVSRSSAKPPLGAEWLTRRSGR